MRVGVIAPGSPGQGGQGAAAKQIAEAFKAAQHTVTYIGSTTEIPPLRRLAGSRPLRRWGLLAREMDRHGVLRTVPADLDLVYTMPGYQPRGTVNFRVVHQATHHPREVIGEVGAARRNAGGGAGFLTKIECKRLEAELAAATVIRAESSIVAQQLADHGIDENRIVLAPPGVDLEIWRPTPKAKTLTFAFIGPLSLWKGLHYLKDTAYTLSDIGARLLVIGGPVCTWSRRIAEQLPAQRTSDVRGALARSHFLLLPSVTEGFGYVVLEALACGAIPFVTPEVGASDLVRHLDPRLIIPGGRFATIVPILAQQIAGGDLHRKARALAEEYDWHRMGSSATDAILEKISMLQMRK